MPLNPHIVVLVGLEMIVIAGSGIDAHWRPAADRRLWVARWVYWHLAPLWLPYRLLILALMAAAVRCAQHTAARHLRRQGEPLSAAVMADDRWPTDPPALLAPPALPALPGGQLRVLALLRGLVRALRPAGSSGQTAGLHR